MQRISTLSKALRSSSVRSTSSGIATRKFSTQNVVLVSYNDLKNDKVDLSEKIDEAFNFSGYGLLAVTDVPEVMQKRKALLSLAFEFANLPDNVKNAYEHEASYYSVGWSHGKELFQGVPDYSKGSWYSNPRMDAPTTDAELIKAYPSYFTANVWPKEVPDMRQAFREMGQLIMSTGVLLAKHCDKFVHSQCSTYQSDLLEKTLVESTVPKGRMLHYFPQTKNELEGTGNVGRDFSSWCGWHNDHGALTGLTSAMFMDKNGNEIDIPDPQAGLYCKTRQGDTRHIAIPRDCLGFQIGEAAQIMTGGVLQATPHAVMGPTTLEAEGISRETLAVFMQPMPQTKLELPAGRTKGDVDRGSTIDFMPEGTAPLDSRWEPGVNFGEFTNRTLSFYH